ncbi:MAG: hypothetical protein NTZ49_00180 [Candidatus Parcubacteria bacterium]|nr:hypothetical protein [Candidatus Parcubacteria bacterium]
MKYKSKRSAHLVIGEMIAETVTKICSLADLTSLEAATLLGMLAAELEMMKRVNISLDDYKALCATLWKIKQSCSDDLAEKLLPAAIFVIEEEPEKNDVTYIPCPAKDCNGLMESKGKSSAKGDDGKSSYLTYICPRCGREQKVQQPRW